MLEGYDTDWNDAGSRKEAFYTNLKPGDYVFRVRASNNDGLWNDEGRSLSIHIRTPFWQTGMLYVVSVDYRWHLLCGLVLSAYET